ncbi:MAG: SAM-dependent methyltransferase [Saprospiraceae bacterium]
MDFLNPLIEPFKESITKNIFIKLSLSKYHGSEDHLKNIYVKKITIKNEQKFSFTYHYETRDIVKNYSIDEAEFMINRYLSPEEFHIANLFTAEADYNLEYLATHSWKLKRLKPATAILPSLDHNKIKVKAIQPQGKPYLYALNITDAKGKVLNHAQDKFKQINHYIEILSSILKDLPEDELIKVIDMGSGKGYLTFALYDYLTTVLSRSVEMTGIEVRSDLVEFCSSVAKQSGFDGLKFEEGRIEQYQNHDYKILIALHACDTATDDAIAHGILSEAAYIIAAPCCHKQIRREIEKTKLKTELDDLIKHGIFLERQAEMITDSIRTLILEYHGYSTKIIDFISDAHTPKNIMILAQKNSRKIIDKPKIMEKINKLKSMFGIEHHYLEKKLNLS